MSEIFKLSSHRHFFWLITIRSNSLTHHFFCCVASVLYCLNCNLFLYQSSYGMAREVLSVNKREQKNSHFTDVRSLKRKCWKQALYNVDTPCKKKLCTIHNLESNSLHSTKRWTEPQAAGPPGQDLHLLTSGTALNLCTTAPRWLLFQGLCEQRQATH